MTDRQLKIIKGEEVPKKDCTTTIPFNEVYPERRGAYEDEDLQGTNITSGRHKSQCSDVTITGMSPGDDPRAIGYYYSTFINLGCKSVN